MRFQVPQFIGVEDKVFGPLTVKQFIYLAGGAGMCFVVVKLLPWYIGIVLAIPFAVLSLALAFYQINNKPFIFTFQSAVSYLFHTRLYIWQKAQKPLPTDADIAKFAEFASIAHQGNTADPLLYVPKMGDSKLKDMSWSLGISKKEAMNPVTTSADVASS